MARLAVHTSAQPAVGSISGLKRSWRSRLQPRASLVGCSRCARVLVWVLTGQIDLRCVIRTAESACKQLTNTSWCWLGALLAQNRGVARTALPPTLLRLPPSPASSASQPRGTSVYAAHAASAAATSHAFAPDSAELVHELFPDVVPRHTDGSGSSRQQQAGGDGRDARANGRRVHSLAQQLQLSQKQRRKPQQQADDDLAGSGGASEAEIANSQQHSIVVQPPESLLHQRSTDQEPQHQQPHAAESTAAANPAAAAHQHSDAEADAPSASSITTTTTQHAAQQQQQQQVPRHRLRPQPQLADLQQHPHVNPWRRPLAPRRPVHARRDHHHLNAAAGASWDWGDTGLEWAGIGAGDASRCPEDGASGSLVGRRRGSSSSVSACDLIDRMASSSRVADAPTQQRRRHQRERQQPSAAPLPQG